MTDKNETELATAVLKHLGVLGNGQSAEAEDLQDVISAYRAKYAELDAAGLEYTYWQRDVIPEEILFVLRDLITLEVANSFGQPLTMTEKEAEETKVLRRLRRHVGKGATGLPTPAEYF